MKHIISMPLCVRWGVRKPKNIYFNLNSYRNWHYMASNNYKKWYKEHAEVKLAEQNIIPFSQPISLEFVLWKGSKRKVDRANPLSVHEKFFCDALVELAYMPDDNDNFIESSFYRTGGIDRENPRVDIIIRMGGKNDNKY